MENFIWWRIVVTSQLIYFPHFCLTSPTVNDLDSLKFVQIIFRHGDKEPDQTYPGGAGKLSDMGKKQMFDLGLYFRSYYPNLVGQEYDPSQIFFVSSDKDRTIQSASLVAYGFYKDFNTAANWNSREKIPFEPIPVHTIPAELDMMISVEKSCPRITQINQREQARVGEKYFKENRKLVESYATNGGPKARQLLNKTRNILDLVVDMHVQHEELTYALNHNESLEEWTAPLFENDNFFSLNLQILRQMVNDTEGKKLLSGSLIKYLLKNMDSKLNAANNEPKLHLLSGHDATIQYLLGSLLLDDFHLNREPPFGASFIIELHQKPMNGESFVKFLYRNDTKKEPFLLKTSLCPDPCTLTQFQNGVAHLIPINIQKLCQAKYESPINFEGAKIKISPKETERANSAGGHSTFLWILLACIVAAIGCALIIQRRRN